LGRTVGAIADSVASAARGRQAGAHPRVVVYDRAGHSRLLKPDTPDYERLLDTASAILEIVAESRSTPPDSAPEAD
jgi:hypothetical protein